VGVEEVAMFSHSLGDGAELRLLEEIHTHALFGLADANRAYLREWLPWLDDTRSPDDIRGFIRIATQQFASNQGYECGIWWHGELVGTIGNHRIDWRNGATSIGYWLGEAYQGRGLMTRACRALVHHAFRTLNLNRVEIRVASGNLRSRAIPLRLGFQEEGILREAEWLYDHYVDHVVYGMLARDWGQ
jgi:ribosomal-protein-serine acetyltransferase